MLIDDTEEYNLIWDRVYRELKFHPDSTHCSHTFDEWVPFKIDKEYVVFDIENMTDIHIEIMDEVIKKAFIACTAADDGIYALDWQHSAFLYNPRNDSDQQDITVKDERFWGGEYNAYFPSFYPDGDYYFFIDKDFRFGYLGHPWRREVWIFGDVLIQQFDKIYKDLGWIKIKEG